MMHVIDAVLNPFSDNPTGNLIERWFREMEEGTKRFYNDVNSKRLKCLEELVTAIAAMHKIDRTRGEDVIPT
jgi:hypothetical protein